MLVAVIAVLAAVLTVPTAAQATTPGSAGGTVRGGLS
ncbi:MAG: hypothetical protein QOF98_1165, partial [Streptomyces sp.]|nr:hypothetical protein [Streptomyces sp.]